MSGSLYGSGLWFPQELDGASGDLFPSPPGKEALVVYGGNWLTAQAAPLTARPQDDGEDDEEDWEDDWDEDEEDDEDEDEWDEDEDEDEDEDDWEDELDEDEYEDDEEDFEDEK